MIRRSFVEKSSAYLFAREEKVNNRQRKEFKNVQVVVGKKNLGLKNAPESLQEYWKNNITVKPLLQQVDSLKTFGLHIPITPDKVDTLAEKIAVTRTKEVHIDPLLWSKNQVLSACEELDLFPLIVPTTEINSPEDIQEITNWFYAFTEQGITDNQVAWGFDLAKYPITDPHDAEVSTDNLDSLYVNVFVSRLDDMPNVPANFGFRDTVSPPNTGAYLINENINWNGWKILSAKFSEFKHSKTDLPLNDIQQIREFMINFGASPNQALVTGIKYDMVLFTVGKPLFE